MNQRTGQTGAKLGLGLALLLLAVAACQAPAEPAKTAAVTATEPKTPQVRANSVEAMMAAQRARQSLPGRKLYEGACASCHEGAVAKAPHREMLSLMTASAINRSLTSGLMQVQAATLSPLQRQQVADYLGGAADGSVHQPPPACAKDTKFNLAQPPATHNWGFELANRRYIPAAVSGIRAADLATLKPQWALAFPGARRVRSQPVQAGGLLFTGSHGGMVYALDANSGCQVWVFQASGEVRTGIVVTPWSAPANATHKLAAQPQLYFGDVLGNVYALDAATGQQRWRDRADPHPNATITGTPSLHQGKLYVPVSALEVSNAIDPNYSCCTFRGSVVAYSAHGKRLWQQHTIAQQPMSQGHNSAGTEIFGPAGAVIWNSPTIDATRQRLYVGTGENSASPATNTSDAIMAFDLQSGNIAWSFQATRNDAWNTACDSTTPANCPKEQGPDFDFGANTMLVTDTQGRDLVIGGQKSGMVHALAADTGKLVWQERVGRGGIQGGIHFGMAADDKRIYVPITDMEDGRKYPNPNRAGVHALDITTGKHLWYAEAPDVCNGRAGCHPGVSQSITVAGDLVLAGGMDGVLRIYQAASGQLLKQVDTTGTFATLNGQPTQGGSFGGAAGPLVQGGKIVLSSGYDLYNHMAGNLFLVLSAE